MDTLVHVLVVKKGGKNFDLAALSEDRVTWYRTPEGRTDLDQYPEVTAIKSVMSACNSISRAGGYRKISLKMSDEMRHRFKDEEGNFRIGDFYLEEQVASGSDDIVLVNRIRELETQISAMTEVSLMDIEKKFLVDKFNGKGEPTSWLDGFEKECKRYKVIEDAKRIETLKIFLEGAALEWYSANLVKLPLSEWEPWRNSFLTVYERKDWANIRKAFSFKYLGGSYVDYVVKKERFLLDADRAMEEKFRIYEIVYGLPIEVQEKLDRQKIQNFDDLVGALKKLPARPAQIRPNEEKKIVENGKKPCTICEGLGFKGRFHPIQSCRNKGSRPRKLINWTEQNETITDFEQVQQKN